MHNISNVLNSLMVEHEFALREVGESKALSHAAQVAQLIEKNALGCEDWINGDSGQQAVSLLKLSIGQAAGQQEQLIERLVTMKQQLACMRDIVVRRGQDCSHEVLSDVDALVGDALRMFGSMFTEVAGELRYEPESNASSRVDQTVVTQVVHNLVKNAWEAGGRAAPRVIVSTRTAGARVQIIVHDDGPGIRLEEAAALFRLGFSTKETGKGLGLHISARQAKDLGGRLFLARAPEEYQNLGGATLVLELPRDDGTPARAPGGGEGE